VALNYAHFRPTGKAILTMALPDYTREAIRAAGNITISGCRVEAEPIEHPELMIPSGSGLTGNGASAGVVVGKTVTLSGLPGKTWLPPVFKMVEGFKLANLKYGHPVRPVPMCVLYVVFSFALYVMTLCLSPEKKFSLYSRFIVQLDSESEAQRFVRKYHMTPFKNSDGAPIIRAEVIY
jgi:hypothetical protein